MQCFIFSVLYLLIAGLTKYLDGEFNSWIPCAACRPTLNNDVDDAAVGKDERSSKGVPTEAESKQAQDEDTKAATVVALTGVELTVLDDDEEHKAACTLQRRFRKYSQYKLKCRTDPNPELLLFQRRSAYVRKIAERRKARAVGHNTTLYADGPEFFGLAEETHQLHRIILTQRDDMAVILQTLKKQTAALSKPFESVDTDSDDDTAASSRPFKQVDTDDEE